MDLDEDKKDLFFVWYQLRYSTFLLDNSSKVE